MFWLLPSHKLSLKYVMTIYKTPCYQVIFGPTYLGIMLKIEWYILSIKLKYHLNNFQHVYITIIVWKCVITFFKKLVIYKRQLRFLKCLTKSFPDWSLYLCQRTPSWLKYTLNSVTQSDWLQQFPSNRPWVQTERTTLCALNAIWNST